MQGCSELDWDMRTTPVVYKGPVQEADNSREEVFPDSGGTKLL